MAAFDEYKCILCLKIPSNKSDINFLDTKENIRTELDDLPFSILPAKSICKACIALINKRRGLRVRLGELNKNLMTVHETALKTVGKPLNFKKNVVRKLGFEDTVTSTEINCIEEHNEPINRFVRNFLIFL